MTKISYSFETKIIVFADSDKLAKKQIERIEYKIKKILQDETERLKKKQVTLEYTFSA